MKLICLIFVLFTSLSLFAKGPSLTQQLEEKSRAGKQKTPPEIKREFARALSELKKSGIEQRAVRKGMMVPKFNLDGIPFEMRYSKKPVILKFYRGSWCPYCQIELKAYQDFKQRIEKRGYQVIILTPDTKKEIQKFKDKRKITFDIYRDPDNSIAKKFGVAFKLDDKVGTLYKKFGIDLNKSQGNENQELPIPGTYVINKKGKITYAFIDADYTKRLDPEKLLKVLN